MCVCVCVFFVQLLFAAEFAVRAIDLDPLLESTPLDLPDVWPWLVLRSSAHAPAPALPGASSSSVTLLAANAAPMDAAAASAGSEAAGTDDGDSDARTTALSTRVLATAAAFGRVGGSNDDDDDEYDLHAPVTLHRVVAARLGMPPKVRVLATGTTLMSGRAFSGADSTVSALPSAIQALNAGATADKKSDRKSDKKVDQKADRKVSSAVDDDDDDDDLQPLHDVSRQSAADLGGGSAQRAPLYLRDLWAYVRAHDSVEKQVRTNEHAISFHRSARIDFCDVWANAFEVLPAAV